MFYDIRANDIFFTPALIFIEKHIKMVIVLFLQESAPNEDVFLSV